jgi:ParB-like chromosome segregation protein Spo0J
MTMIETARIKDVTTAPLFRNLFPRPEEMIETISVHMKQYGFDPSQPIVCWSPSEHDKKPIVIDGHTRLAAATRCNLPEIYINIKTFETQDEALAYAIHNQRDRRNMTDADLIRCIEAVDKTKQRGGDRKSEKSKASSDAIDPQGKSSEETAKVVGTSARKVEKARTVIKNADPETKLAVLEGEKSINQAYQETKAKNPSEPSPTKKKPLDESVTNERPSGEEIKPFVLKEMSASLDRIINETMTVDCVKKSSADNVIL